MGRSNNPTAHDQLRRSIDMGDMLAEARAAVELSTKSSIYEGAASAPYGKVEGHEYASARAAAAAMDAATHACIEAWKAEEAAPAILQICALEDDAKNQCASSKERVAEIPAAPGKAAIIPDDHDTVAVLSSIASVLVEVIDINLDPELRLDIYYFFAHNYQLAQWSPETNIAACVLLLRWCNTGYPLTKENWRITALVSLMISQKINDDIPLGNREFCILWQRVVVDAEDPGSAEPLSCGEINALERKFLKEVNYQAFINSETLIEVYSELMMIS